MPVTSTQASTRPELQHEHGGQPAEVAEELGQRPRAARRRPRRQPAAGRWCARAGSADSRAGELTGRSSQKPSVRSARRAERSRRSRRVRSRGPPTRSPLGPAAWASARKCSSGKYSSRSPCTSSSGVGAIALTTCSGDGGASATARPAAAGRPATPTRRPAVVSSSQCTRRIGRVSRTYQRLTALTLTTASGRCRPSAAWRSTAPPPIDRPRVTTASAPSARAAATAASTSRSSGSPPVPEPPPDRP